MPSFNVEEVFEMACQIERNGAKFYTRAARQSRSERQRKLLNELAERERKHEKTFADMLDRLGDDRHTEMYDPEDEALLYLRAMVEGKVFDAGSDPSARLTGRESYEEILDTAIGLEKDSIAFYLGLQQWISSQGDRQTVGQILHEEMRHVTILAREKARSRKSSR